jgi:hypothetical protein
LAGFLAFFALGGGLFGSGGVASILRKTSSMDGVGCGCGLVMAGV